MLLLSALFYGLEIKLEGNTYRLFQCVHDGFKMGIIDNGNLIGVDMTIEHFTRMCETAPPEYTETVINQMAFSKVVTNHGRKQ